VFRPVREKEKNRVARLSVLFQARFLKKKASTAKPTQSKKNRVSAEKKGEFNLSRTADFLDADARLIELAQPKFLSVDSILRPEGELKIAMEGFLIDLRSEHTRRSYSKDLKRFFKFLHGKRAEGKISRIDRSALIAYKDFLLQEGLQHTTIDRHLSTLRSFFQWLVDEAIIEKSPATQVRFLSPKRVSKTLGFTNQEVLSMLSAPDFHTRTGALHRAILAVLFYCGLRRSELCAIRLNQWQQERGHSILRLQGKGNRERVVVLPPVVVKGLEHYLKITGRVRENEGERFLFLPVKDRLKRSSVGLDKPLDPSMIFYIVRRCAKLSGVQSKVSPHSCRATAISNARDHQVTDRAIQEFAGWTSPSMLTHYDKRRTAIDQSASLAIQYEKEGEVS